MAEDDEQMSELPTADDGDLVAFLRTGPDFSLIPGADERIAAGIADADAGRTIPLDQL